MAVIAKIWNKGKSFWKHGKHNAGGPNTQDVTKRRRPLDVLDTTSPDWASRRRAKR